ncbi:hypothetical protein K1720_05135 [Thermococcus argininiproducens]|uniref:FUN14 family protein n=1 Tax=Thermococcus argininiproducens TaxID=2866384 RepID=A0A9E7SD53_9EURY|nr:MULTISPECIES: FUN14 domain-containing protein [Thermococcus]NJE25378.1 hypothetical protein [Thermococcus sp. MV5]USH00804.1 hypothetical protein K1720_05135 [Thermococcus argininiproducens]
MNFDISGIMGDMGIGAVVGFITGYALKKFIKIVLTLIGAYILSLFWLQQKGVISINTDALFNLAESATTSTLTLAERAIGILPGTGAFVAGFYLGFRKG